jgi:hypothetical protein
MSWNKPWPQSVPLYWRCLECGQLWTWPEHRARKYCDKTCYDRYRSKHQKRKPLLEDLHFVKVLNDSLRSSFVSPSATGGLRPPDPSDASHRFPGPPPGGGPPGYGYLCLRVRVAC